MKKTPTGNIITSTGRYDDIGADHADGEAKLNNVRFAFQVGRILIR